MAEVDVESVLHVVVVGFHHKKGAQVEYAFPPLVEGQPPDSNEVPSLWKHLPSLALPDGAHNYDKDTVYFHLPSKSDTRSTVFGVSCYRQIDAKDVRNKGSEVTRNSIQKAVCVLSSLPLYGLIEAKLEMITYAWFKEKDFTQVSLLEETYRQLTASCTASLLEGSQVFLGLSCRELVLKLKHKVVVLFKLLLLERKVLVYGSPAKPVCTTLLSLLSLFPDMIEYGLKESAAYSANRVLSPTMKNVRLSSNSEEFLEIHYTDDNKNTRKEKRLSNELQQGTVISQNPNGSGDGKSHTHVLKDSSGTQLDQSASELSSQPHIVNTPSPICEKSECELSEKNTEALEKIPQVTHAQNHLSKTQSPIYDTGKNKSSNINDAVNSDLKSEKSESIPWSDSQHKSDANHAMLSNNTTEEKEKSKNSSSVSDNKRQLLSTNGTALDSSINLPDPPIITHTTQPQPGNSPLIVDQSASDYNLSQTISRDTLASEGTASDFGPGCQVEELLGDQEECFSWRDDQLLLAIDNIATGNMADHFDGRLTFEPEETQEMADMDQEGAEKREGVTRNDSTHSRTSQGSFSSMAGDLGEAGVKVMSGLRDKFSSMWDSTASDGMEEGALPTVHRQASHSSQSGQSSSESSPSKASVQSETERPVTPTTLTTDECGFPLAIFTKSLLCHPYLSLQYYDLLQDVNVRGFLIGASNMLFRQKRHLLDVVIELPELSVEIHDEALRRQLVLSTADLRFADFLVKSVCEDQESVYDETEWEGGDEWLRSQFKLYLASLLVTVDCQDEKLKEDFNPVFVGAFRTTHSYKLWRSVERRGLKEAPPGHPFQGQLSMQDIRMRFAQYERGKKLMDAAGQTGKVAVQTGKAIGGAFSTAKTAVSSTVGGWFSNIRKWSSSDNPMEDAN